MKQLTRDQVESRKAKAVRFVRDVVGDSGRADEIEDESLEDYAEKRKFQITNPNLKRRTKMPSNTRTKAELEDENQELRDQLDAINDILSTQLDFIRSRDYGEASFGTSNIARNICSIDARQC